MDFIRGKQKRLRPNHILIDAFRIKKANNTILKIRISTIEVLAMTEISAVPPMSENQIR